MNSEELPEYKRTFLQEMEVLRQQQQAETNAEVPLPAPIAAERYACNESDHPHRTIFSTQHNTVHPNGNEN